MNETQKISIAGIGFVLDRTAYDALHSYLDRLEKAYASNPDRNEIIGDIEARIVELILSKQTPEQVVSLSLTEEIIGQLGDPDTDDGGSEAREDGPAERPFSRRLYRNPDGAKLGGVCNGLGTFLGVDPVWIRLGVFAPLFMLIILPASGFHYINGFLGALFGALVLLYFIMWIVVPVARTPRQKLEMVGEGVTARSIERRIAQDASAMPPETRKSASVMARLFVTLGKVIVFGIKAVLVVLAFAFSVAAVAVTVSMAVLPFMPELLTDEAAAMFVGVKGVSPVGYVTMVLALVAIPFAVLAYQIARLVFRFRNSRLLMLVLCGTWLVQLASTGVVTMRNADSIRDNYENRYNDFGFVLDRTNLDRVGTVVLYGDTVIRQGQRLRRKDLERLHRRIDTASNFRLDFSRKSGKFTLNISQPEDSTGRRSVSLGFSLDKNDKGNGNNQ